MPEKKRTSEVGTIYHGTPYRKPLFIPGFMPGERSVSVKCIVCGKEFTPEKRKHRAKTCSEECSRINSNERRRQYQKEHAEKYNKNSQTYYWKKKRKSKHGTISLEEAARLAREEGLSYGQWMARRYLACAQATD